eukprot:scaffold66645_cov60-Phaeocystis_antarctica.AAC.5
MLARSLEGLRGTGVVSALQPRKPALEGRLRLGGRRLRPPELRLARRCQEPRAAADHWADRRRSSCQ